MSGRSSSSGGSGSAYWGASKYYQKKATKDPAGRFSYTDYYPNTASAGSKGQTYQVYSPAFTTFTNGDGGAPDSDWPDDLTPASATYSAQFSYDSKGRATDVYKLQSATTTPWKYVQAHTTYGSDTDGSWGEVVEDYGGIGRTTTGDLTEFPLIFKSGIPAFDEAVPACSGS